MIIFNHLTEEDFCVVDKSTKSVFLAVFGFLKHADHEQVLKFFAEQGWPVVQPPTPVAQYPVDTAAALVAYQVCDRRSVDTTFVLTLPFPTVVEAKAAFEERVRKSLLNVTMEMFPKIVALDADKFKLIIQQAQQAAAVKRVARQVQRQREQVIDQEEQVWRQGLQAKFAHDPDMLRYLKNRFK